MDIMMLFLRDCASRDRFILRNLGFVGVPVFPRSAVVEGDSVGDPAELRSDADHIAARKGGSAVIEGFPDGHHDAVSTRLCVARSLHLEASGICGCPILSPSFLLGFLGVPVFRFPVFHRPIKQIHDLSPAESSCNIDGLFTAGIGQILARSRFQERSHDAESPVPTTCPVQRRVARIHRLNVGVCTVCQKYTHHGGSARSARSMQWRFSRAIQDVYAPALAQEPPNSPVIADPRISMHGRFRSAITCIGVFIVRDAVAVSHVS